MEIKRIQPRVITYSLIPSREDAEYASCMWARYIFDCDNGRLNINSDAGDYTYGWGHNVHEDFMHLMGRVGEEYLLNKLSSRSVFKIAESKAKTINNIKKDGFDYLGIENQEQMDSVVEEILEIDDWISEEMFYREVSDIFPGIDFEEIEIEKDYPYGATVVVRMFMQYLQPKIKEELEFNGDVYEEN